jgi:hypothetical protein
MNDDSRIYYFIAFCLVVFVGWIVIESIRNYKIQRMASKAMFTHSLLPNTDQIAIPESSLFEKGHTDRFSNLVQGELKGVRFQAFDYTYTTVRGKYSNTYNNTIFVFYGKRNYPFFDLEPEKSSPFFLLDKIPEELDIAIGSKEFDKHYVLKGGRIAAIKKVFKYKGLAKRLLKHRLAVTVQGNMVMIYKPNNRVKPFSYLKKLNLYCEHALEIMKANA